MTARLILPLLGLFQILSADTLTLHEAIELGLNHNFSIRIARNNTEKNYNNRKLKIGALLPTVRVDDILYQPVTDDVLFLQPDDGNTR